jgi:putative hydrolase of the HAD superfamily
MSKAGTVKNIIFDLGGVLLNIDPMLTVQALTEMGVNDMVAVHGKLIEASVYQRFDSGISSPAQFRNDIRKNCGLPLSDEQIDEAWNALLLDFPASRVKMMQELSPNYRLFLLSNTNSIHYETYTSSFRETFHFEMPSLFERLFLSYELGCHKPDPEIYHKVLSLGEFIPEETLFIDDSKANAEAAAKSGMLAFHLKEGMDITSLFKNGKLRTEAEFLLP